MIMNIMDRLSADEKRMLLAYIESYGFAGGEGGTVKTTIENLLRFWAREKSEYLLPMFGGELILQKELVYKKSISDLEDEMNRKFYHYDASETPEGKFMRRFNDFGWNSDRGFTRDAESAWSWLCSCRTLATNVYDGQTVSISTPEGKEIKIANGCRATRVIGKLAKAFGIDEGFEEFRIAHSIVLNQKELKGNLCLSIHPMDYFTMSDNDCDWESCMSWVNNGCYRMGTVEMMNSPMVIVAYLTASEDMHVPCGTWNNKKWRELYIVNKDIITNVKAYPYKNDDLTKEVLAWLKQLAEAQGLGKYDEVPFDWNYNYQSDSPRLYEHGIRLNFETHFMYNDFDSDAGQWSYLSENYPADNGHWINYSGESMCMCCGETNGYYDGEGSLVCEDCDEIIRCDDCGDRIYDSDDVYTVDGQTLCYGCYDNHTVECTFSGDTHMRYNCEELCIAWDEDAPLEGRTYYYDRGWCNRGNAPMEKGINAICRNTRFYIYEEHFDEAVELYTKSGSYETFSRRWSNEVKVVRMSDLTEKFAKDAGYETLDEFIKDLKSSGEVEVD